jgi:hypothetical protein
MATPLVLFPYRVVFHRINLSLDTEAKKYSIAAPGGYTPNDSAGTEITPGHDESSFHF